MNRITIISQTLLSNAYEHSKGRIGLAVLIVSLLALHGMRKKSLSLSGGISAWLIGLITCLSGWSFAVSLLSFYMSSSYLTKYKSSLKKKLEENHQTGGQRNYIQVLSNSINAAICGLFFLLFSYDSRITYINSTFKFDAFLICAVVGHYASCNGDTWASELGILNKKRPILITTLKPVPPGTNGGVSPIGLAASLAGGTFVGLVYFYLSPLFNQGPPLKSQLPIIYLAAFGGLFGSLVDSLMGATLQYSGWNKNKSVVTNNPPSKSSGLASTSEIEHICGIDILDNHQVNFLSSFLTSMICGFIGCSYLF